MGGKALKNTKTERKTTQQFYDIQSRLFPKLNELLGLELYVLKFYHSKPDHGDMDILVKIPNNFNINIFDEIKNNIQPNQIVTNDGTVTFDFEEFQIDLIPVQENIWESTKIWMDYDPCGNLCGKITHRFGLKFGPEGLVYQYRNSGKFGKNITITNDFDRIMNFLGLDPNVKHKGFDTLEEIYKWIISSKYYNTELFLLDNLTQSDRKRNKKRPTFNNFLEYVKNIPYTSEGYHFEKNKTKYLDFIDSSFPEVHFLEQINELNEKYEEKLKLKTKFNGDLLMEWSGLSSGKKLGQIMESFKKTKNDKWFEENTVGEIKNEFKKWFNTLENGNEI